MTSDERTFFKDVGIVDTHLTIYYSNFNSKRVIVIVLLLRIIELLPDVFLNRSVIFGVKNQQTVFS